MQREHRLAPETTSGANAQPKGAEHPGTSGALDSLPRPLALLFSGGASLGALQVGQLRALIAGGLVPDFVVGTSVGALNALFIAQDFGPARLAALEQLWRGLTRELVFGKLGLAAAWRLMRSGNTAASPKALQTLIACNLPKSQDQLALPAHLIATDFISGRPVTLSGGDLHRNALASAAIPGVFPPVEIAGRPLVDGGISANVPLGPAAALGAKTLIVLDAGYPCAAAAPPPGMVPSLLQALTLALRTQVQLLLPGLARDHTVLYLPAPCPLVTAPHDFSGTEALLSAGYELARDFLQACTVDGPGIWGHPHIH